MIALTNSYKDEEDILKFLEEYFGQNSIVGQIQISLIEFIEKHRQESPTPEKLEQLKNLLVRHFDYCLEKGFLASFNSKEEKQPSIQKALNTLYGYWVILTRLEPKYDFLKFETRRTQFITFFKIFTSYYHSKSNRTSLKLAHQSLNDGNFIGYDFSGKNLNEVGFNNADLRLANFTNADLQGCNFTNADLRYADFTNAKNIEYATFLDAELGDATFNQDPTILQKQLSEEQLSEIISIEIINIKIVDDEHEIERKNAKTERER